MSHPPKKSIKEPCIRWGQDRTNQFAVLRRDKTAMRPFAKSRWTLVFIIIITSVLHSGELEIGKLCQKSGMATMGTH